jgi:hypothetical protein
MTRPLNVVLKPGSAAHKAFAPPTPKASAEPAMEALANGFTPQPAWNLQPGQGRTIADLTFVNCYVGPAGAWEANDMERIDSALKEAMSDANLQKVIAQYYPGAITSTMLPSIRHEAALPKTVYKDTVQSLAKELQANGALGGADQASSIINIMLPKAIVLSSEPAPEAQRPAGGPGEAEPPAGEENEPPAEEGNQEPAQQAAAASLDRDKVESTEGLGGYHGSIHLAASSFLYAAGVYSEGNNGIAAFDEPWKSVVATFYHELNEARTDPDVEDVTAGHEDLLGWYSQTGQGEIGDLPINACGGDLKLVFVEVDLANGKGRVPIQIMWSNEVDGPAAG